MTKKKETGRKTDSSKHSTEKKPSRIEHHEIYTCPNCQNTIIINPPFSEAKIITCDKCHTQALIEPPEKQEMNNGLYYKALNRDQEPSSYACPHCHNIITLNSTPVYSFIIKCPYCHKSALYDHVQKKMGTPPKPLQKIHIDKQKKSKYQKQEQGDQQAINQEKKKWFYQPYIRARILGILLITFGAGIYLFFHDTLSIKLGLSLILVGIISNILISEKRFMIIDTTTNESEEFSFQQTRLLYSEKLTIIIAVLIFAMFLITNAASIELFFILIYLGLLIIKELTDEMTPKHVRVRMNVFIIGFFILFILIIIKRITTIING